jgi:hypothetical protein
MDNGCGLHAAGRVEMVASLGTKLGHGAAEHLQRGLRLLCLFQRLRVLLHEDDAGAEGLSHFAKKGCVQKSKQKGLKDEEPQFYKGTLQKLLYWCRLPSTNSSDDNKFGERRLQVSWTLQSIRLQKT